MQDLSTRREPVALRRGRPVGPAGCRWLDGSRTDVPAALPCHPGDTYSVSLSGDADTELRGYWDRLTEGGTVVEPLVQAPWGDAFGMCTDRFGIAWLVNIAGPAA